MEVMDIGRLIVFGVILIIGSLVLAGELDNAKVNKEIAEKQETKKYIIEYFHKNIKKVIEVPHYSIHLYHEYGLVNFRKDNTYNVIDLNNFICIKTIQGDILYTKEQLERRTSE